MESIELEYINWIKNLIALQYYSENEHLIDYLYSMDYIVIKPTDDNRRIDGLDLRYRFLYEAGYSNEDAFHIVSNILNKPCSVLEFMVALAYRIDEDIMYDWEIGSRVYKWFWEMIESLGLNKIDDETYIYKVITEFMHYHYSANGKGNIFTVNAPDLDLRDYDIWEQTQIYLNSII